MSAKFEAGSGEVSAAAAREAARRALENRYRAEEAPMRADLARVGWRVESVYDLVNGSAPYPAAIPVLLQHLQRPYSDRIKEGIARALSVREARPTAGPVLFEVLRNAADNDAACRWAIANALTVVADRSHADDLQNLIEGEADERVRERLERAAKLASARKPSRG